MWMVSKIYCIGMNCAFFPLPADLSVQELKMYSYFCIEKEFYAPYFVAETEERTGFLVLLGSTLSSL